MKKGDRVLVLEWGHEAKLLDGLFLPFGSLRGYIEFPDRKWCRKEGPFPLEKFLPYSQEAVDKLGPLMAWKEKCYRALEQADVELQAAFEALREVSDV